MMLHTLRQAEMSCIFETIYFARALAGLCRAKAATYVRTPKKSRNPCSHRLRDFCYFPLTQLMCDVLPGFQLW